MDTVGSSAKVSIFGQEPPECCPERVPHSLVTWRSHLGAQGEAGIGVHRLRQYINDLLYMFDIHLLAAV